eukprot:gene3101-5271_t
MKKNSVERIGKIFNFWFGKEINNQNFNRIWFEKSTETDEFIIKNFKQDLISLTTGEYEDWKQTPEGVLASVLIVDQFTRNMFRGSSESWNYDNIARELADFAIENKFDVKLEPIQRMFLYLPYEHAETMEYQEKSLTKFMELKKEMNHPIYDQAHQYAVAHFDIIKRFGRYPHRNEILKRESTEEEIEFLKDPKNSF